MEQSTAIKSLSAFAHDGRLTLMRRLIQAGPEGVGASELAKFAGTAMSTASAQLLVLSNAGLIGSRRDGRYVTYFADYAHISQVMSFLLHDCCGNRKEICCVL